jgi:hypothetical protein
MAWHPACPGIAEQLEHRRPLCCSLPQARIFLDRPETCELRTFLHFNQGEPGLTIPPSNHIVERGFSSVEGPRVLMAIVRDVSRSYFPLQMNRYRLS